MLVWADCIFFVSILIIGFKIAFMDVAISELKREIKELKNKENEEK